MDRILAIPALVLCLVLVACPSTASQVTPATVTTLQAEASEGALGPKDLIEVRVYGEEDLTGEYQVESDGTINFPLIGSVPVAGLTPTSASQRIAAMLENGYLRRADVTIRIVEVNSRLVHVLGHVKEPGTFPYAEGMTVVQAVTLAGGLEEGHAANRMTITRQEGDDQEIIRVRFGDVSKGRAENLLIRPGDRVFVPESPI